MISGAFVVSTSGRGEGGEAREGRNEGGEDEEAAVRRETVVSR